MPTDHERLCEIAYWKDLLVRVARDMDATSEREVDHKPWFAARARRIRELVDQPVPPGWSQETSTINRR